MNLKNCRQSSGISGRDRIVVSTSRCGRDNPGSNPGHGMPALLPYYFDFACNTDTWQVGKSVPCCIFVDMHACMHASRASNIHRTPLAMAWYSLCTIQHDSHHAHHVCIRLSNDFNFKLPISLPCIQDEVAEWLRRWTANPLCSARVGSNPILVAMFYFNPVQQCFMFSFLNLSDDILTQFAIPPSFYWKT